MADYITLTCPSCGAKLEDDSHDGKFVCAYCGQRHVLYQGDKLKPDDGSSFSEPTVYPSYPATDINSLYSEIEELNHKKNRILAQFSKSTEKFGAITVFGIMVILLSLMLFCDRSEFALLVCLAGCALMFWARHMRKAAQKDKDAFVSSKIRELDEQIKLKMDEMQRSINEDGAPSVVIYLNRKD